MTLQSIKYTAHTKNEFQEVSQSLASKMSSNLRTRGKDAQPVKVLLGPCIALVNVFITNVDINHAEMTIYVSFVEAPRVPA